MATLKIVKSARADWKVNDNVGDISVDYFDNTHGEVINLNQRHFKIVLEILNSANENELFADHTIGYFRVVKTF